MRGLMQMWGRTRSIQGTWIWATAMREIEATDAYLPGEAPELDKLRIARHGETMQS